MTRQVREEAVEKASSQRRDRPSLLTGKLRVALIKGLGSLYIENPGSKNSVQLLE